MPTCPKCNHEWKNRSNKTGPKIVITDGVFEQKCWKCEKLVKVGDKVIAATHMPVAICLACASEHYPPSGHYTKNTPHGKVKAISYTWEKVTVTA